MRQTCCQQQQNHVISSNHNHHHHHHGHQPCHAFPSSTLAPLSASSASSSGGAAVAGTTGVNGVTTCCVPPAHSYHTTLFNGTATLPASYSSAANEHFASSSSSSSCSYYRSRSIGPNQLGHQCSLYPASCMADQQNCCTSSSNWLPFSRRAIALFALSLVFILIWSSVVSYVLLTDSFKSQQTTKQTTELFELHRDVGQLAFEVGEEMLFTLNATMTALYSLNGQEISNSTTSKNTTFDIVALPKTINETTTPVFDNSTYSTAIPILSSSTTAPTPTATTTQPLMIIEGRWNKTDALLRQIGQSLATKGYLDFESDVYDQLEKLRNKCVHQVSSAWPTTLSNSNSGKSKPNSSVLSSTINISTLWPLFTDCVRTFEQSFVMLDNILMKEHFTSFAASRSERQQQQQAQYSKMTMTDLLIRNMPYTLFVRGIVHRFTSLSFGLILVRSNFSQPFNMSEYFHYYFSSRQLIESSFVWNYRFLSKYQELESTDYQADMLLTFFDSRRAQENDFYLKMSAIFSRVFSFETLTKIRSYIKKKNVESVERLLVVNGSGTKFVADQDANLMSIQLNTDLIELMGLENIEQVMYGHQQMLNQPTNANLQQKYDRLLRNQIGFMSRVQDFLNISLSAHLTTSSLNGEQSLQNHIVLCTILLVSVFFTLTLFTCSGCCYRSPNPTSCGALNCPHQLGKANYHHATTTLSRRFRRRLWNIGYSPFSLFKLCFNGTPFFSSSTSSAASATSPPRYPLLYKSNYQQPHSPSTSTFGHRQCHYNHHYHHHQHHPASPSSNVITSGRKTGAFVNRFTGNTVAQGTSRELSKAATKSRYQNGGDNKLATTEEMLLMVESSSTNNKTASEPSCMCCIDNGCPSSPSASSSENSNLITVESKNVFEKKEATDENSSKINVECSKCAVESKCSSCSCQVESTDEQTQLSTKKEQNSISSVSVKSNSSNNSSKESSKQILLDKTP